MYKKMKRKIRLIKNWYLFLGVILGFFSCVLNLYSVFTHFNNYNFPVLLFKVSLSLFLIYIYTNSSIYKGITNLFYVTGSYENGTCYIYLLPITIESIKRRYLNNISFKSCFKELFIETVFHEFIHHKQKFKYPSIFTSFSVKNELFEIQKLPWKDRPSEVDAVLQSVRLMKIFNYETTFVNSKVKTMNQDNLKKFFLYMIETGSYKEKCYFSKRANSF